MISKTYKQSCYLLVLFVLLFSGCSDVEPDNQTPKAEVNEHSVSNSAVDDNQMRVMALPTPVQIASILSAYGVLYNPERLTPTNESHVYASNYSRAICSGVYAVDLGYAALFDDREHSIKYYMHLHSILSDMGVKIYSVNELNKRFRANLENPDSLSQIILKTYDVAHRFLIINEQEDVGYYLLSGSYLEGLSLLCQSKENGHFRGKKELFNNLFSQQQIFLENLIEVGNYTTDLTDNSQQLLDLLISIRNVFTSCKAKIVNGKLQLDTIPKKEDLMKIQENIADYKAIVMS